MRQQQELSDKLKAAGLKLPLYPPPQIIERARQVMGGIDFDPTSDAVQQVLVDATAVPSIEINPLMEHWHGRCFIAAKGAMKNSRMWWNKTISEYRNGHISEFIFFTCASEILRVCPDMWSYPMCVPYRRIRQFRATRDGFEAISPSTWNVIVYGPPVEQALNSIDKLALFHSTFRDLGRVSFNEWAGDNWMKDYEYFKEQKGEV